MNRERKALTMVALTLIALLGFIHPAHAASKAIPMTTVAAYASQIAGKPTTIACDLPATKSGSTAFDGVIHLNASECSNLVQVNQSARINTLSGFAMLTLQHEAEHIALNSGDEGLVECTAVQNRWQLVRLFKLPAAVARQIMAWELDAHNAITDPAYRTNC